LYIYPFCIKIEKAMDPIAEDSTGTAVQAAERWFRKFNYKKEDTYYGTCD